MKKLLVIACLLYCAAARATPQTVADAACPKYAVDIAAFATCEGDRVVTPEEEVPLRPLVDDDGMAMPTSPAALPRDRLSRSTTGLYLTPAEARTFKRWLGDSVLFVDVRPAEIIHTGGLAEAADTNIPLAGNVSAFRAAIARAMSNSRGKSASVVFLICQDGRLAARAADALAEAGFLAAFVVRGGVDGVEREVRPDELAMSK